MQAVTAVTIYCFAKQHEDTSFDLLSRLYIKGGWNSTVFLEYWKFEIMNIAIEIEKIAGTAQLT